jgi:glycosyltransferase involved in cell wall biosynthesis
MKIIVVSASLPKGASEAFLIPEILEMRKQGHDVLLVPMHPRGGRVHSEAEILDRMSLVRGLFDAGILAGSLISFLFRPRATVRTLASIVKRSRNFPILCKNLAVFPKGLWLANLARKWGAEHIHSYWISTSATLAMVAASIARRPWSATAYRWDIAENNMIAEKSQSASFIRVADRNGTDELARLTSERGCPFHTIHSGATLPDAGVNMFLDEARLLGIQETNTGIGQKSILVPAMFVPKKGHAYLVDAMALLSRKGGNFRCLFVGDGPLLEETKRRIDKAGLTSNAVFAGAVSHTALLGLMNPLFSDVVVLPSVETEDGEKEGIPMSLIEAMAQGIPVIATRTGGIPELLDDGCGIMVEQRDALSLCQAIETVFHKAPAVDAMVKNSRQRIVDDYSAPAIVARLCALFEDARAR